MQGALLKVLKIEWKIIVCFLDSVSERVHGAELTSPFFSVLKDTR